MENELHTDREEYRLIVLSQDRHKVLLLADKNRFAVPSAEVPRWQRVAENLTAATLADLGCEAISLFAPQMTRVAGESNGHQYQVLECRCKKESHTDNSVWAPIQSLTADSFEDSVDHRALLSALSEANCYEGDPKTSFAHCGWFSELCSWVTKEIQPLGLQLSGTFRQFNASPSFSLVRFETSGAAVWFKATGEPNVREFHITQKLAELFPQHLPKIIATRPDWNGWIALESEGVNLDDSKEITDWMAAAEALAKLQVDSIGQTTAIAEAGARDVRTSSLEAMVDPFLEVMACLMKEQTKVPPPILSAHELALLGIRLRDALALLDEFGVPDALGHLDLNPGNVICCAPPCVFLDWAEAYVGHPFFSFEYLLEHFRRARDRDAALEFRLAGSYSAPWEQVVPASIIAEVRQFTPLVAAFADAAGTEMWRDQDRLEDPLAAGYLRSLARRMNREASHLADRRLPCLS